MDNELVVSDCEVPTPELSLITSDAVSPRLLSRKSTTIGYTQRDALVLRLASLYRAINAMQKIEILKRDRERKREREKKKKRLTLITLNQNFSALGLRKINSIRFAYRLCLRRQRALEIASRVTFITS